MNEDYDVPKYSGKRREYFHVINLKNKYHLHQAIYKL